MKLTLTLDLTRADSLRLGQNSIERVINTSTFLIGSEDDNSNTRELTDINLQDWEELKPLVVRLWGAAQNARFIALEEEQRL